MSVMSARIRNAMIILMTKSMSRFLRRQVTQCFIRKRLQRLVRKQEIRNTGIVYHATNISLMRLESRRQHCRM